MKLVTNAAPIQVTLNHPESDVAIYAENHLELIRKLLPLSDKALFVSPYLYRDFSNFLSGLNGNIPPIELITTCAPKGDDQLIKPFSLKSFGSLIKELKGEWPHISIDQRLHSKIYVFFIKGMPFAGIITSANLTKSGLTSNHETGLLITDKDLLIETAASARAGVQYLEITESQVELLCTAASAVMRNTNTSTDINVGLENLLERYATPSESYRPKVIREFRDFYIKISGVRDRPILPSDQIAFDEPNTILTFAKPPSQLSLGDCLLEVAVGGMCFLSYYSCSSAVFEFTDEEKARNKDNKRWPYYVHANNLSLHYGRNWFNAPLYYESLIQDFLSLYPESNVTAVGGDNLLGAIQRGHSYIRVTPEFARFVMTKIDEFRH